MRRINYKFIGIVVIALIVIVILTWILFSPKNYSNTLPINNVTSILSIKNNVIYYMNGDVLVARQLNSRPEDFTVIAKKVSLAQPSISHSKILFISSFSSDPKINVLNIDSNQQTDLPMYDSFFWQKDILKLVDTNSKGMSNIIGDGKIEYSNLPFSKFISYSDLILGNETSNPELTGFQWKVINPPNNSFNLVSINNFTVQPWVVGDYLLYHNNDGDLVRVNNQGELLNTKKKVKQSELSSNNSNLQHFIEINKNDLVLNSINLDSGSVNKLKTIPIDTKLLSLSNGISQVYESNNSIYILINNKVLVIEL